MEVDSVWVSSPTENAGASHNFPESFAAAVSLLAISLGLYGLCSIVARSGRDLTKASLFRLISTEVLVLNEKQANGAGRVRELIDIQFKASEEWEQSRSGDIDWVKGMRFNQSIVSRIGIEVQVSGRSDLLARDIIHIRNSLQDSRIDVGVIVVPSDGFEYYLTDRVANFSYAMRYVEHCTLGERLLWF